MSSSPNSNTLAERLWPAEGLERQEACPVCGGQSRSLLYNDLTDGIYHCSEDRWMLYRCATCRSGYLDPRPSPDTIGRAYTRFYTHAAPAVVSDGANSGRTVGFRESLRNGLLNMRYGYHFAPASPLGRLLPLVPPECAWAARTVRHLHYRGPNRCLLDIGCGNGAFVAVMREAGWEAQGIDPDPAAVKAGQESGLPLRQGLLDESAFDGEAFDAVTLNHVMEHLHDPQATLRNCRRILKAGGLLWIATPNLDSYGRAEFGKRWYGLDAPRHLVLFTPDSLKKALEAYGFQVVVSCTATWSARWMYQLSATVAADKDTASPLPLSRQLRYKAWKADLGAWLRPKFNEEVVVIARKT